MTTLAPVEVANEVATVIDPSCWDQTVLVASDVGNWISDAAVHTAVWIKDAAVWLAEGAVIIWDFVCDIAIKVYCFIAPYFVAFGQWVADTAVAAYEWVADFVNKYPVETIVGSIALVVGAVFALLIERLCGLCCGSSAVDSRLIIPATIVGEETQLMARTLREQLAALGNNPTDAQVKEVVVRIATERERTLRPADVRAAATQIDAYWNSGMTNAFNLITFFQDQQFEIKDALPDAAQAGLNAVAALPAGAPMAAIETALIDALIVPAAQQAAVRSAIAEQALPVATTSSLAYAKAAHDAYMIGLGQAAAAGIARGADRGPIATMIMTAMQIPDHLKDHVRAAISAFDSSHLAPEAIPPAIAEYANTTSKALLEDIEKGRNAAQRAASNADRNVIAGLIIAAMKIDQQHHAVVTQAVVGAAVEATPSELALAGFAAIPVRAYQGQDQLIERARIAAAVAQAAPGNQRAQVAQAMLDALNIPALHAAAVTAAIDNVPQDQGAPLALATAAITAFRASEQAAAAALAAQQAAAAAQAAAVQ